MSKLQLHKKTSPTQHKSRRQTLGQPVASLWTLPLVEPHFQSLEFAEKHTHLKKERPSLSFAVDARTCQERKKKKNIPDVGDKHGEQIFG